MNAECVWTRIRENNPSTTAFDAADVSINYLDDEEREALGSDVASNTHVTAVNLSDYALTDRRISSLFRGLTRSDSIKEINLHSNEVGAAGVRSMVPFLQNANNLTELNLGLNDIQSEGFNLLLRSLRDSPIETLYCCSCGIESIEIDIENKPMHLKMLSLFDNKINADGCRELAKLLQGEDATLERLYLGDNEIDDEGVQILVDALQSNMSLRELYSMGNKGVTEQGKIMLLKLVNDISSIEATLQSNHILKNVKFCRGCDQIQGYIDAACGYTNQCIVGTRNLIFSSPEKACRMKAIQTQLNSERRAALTELQGVSHSVSLIYSEIDPLHLPEVLALVGKHHGQGELFVALRSSIAGVISTVNEKECLKQENSYYRAKIAEYKAKLEANEAKIAVIEAAEAPVVDIRTESRCNKRRKAS